MKYTARRVFMCCMLIMMLGFITGCWDKKELNEVAVVIGVGIDLEDDGLIRVTAQVIKPNPKGPGGASGGAEIPTWSLTAANKTVMDAISELNRISPRRLYWPHLQIIVFGEKLAKEGLASVLTYFERDRDNRSGTYVVITHGTAEDLLNQKIELGSVPTKAMADLLETADKRQLTVRGLTLRKLTQDLVTEGIDPSIDVVNTKLIRGKPETYKVSHAAIFKGDKLIEISSTNIVTAIAMTTGEYKGGVLSIPCPGEKDKNMTFLTTDYRVKRKITQANNQFQMKLDIFMEGNLGDQTCEKSQMNQEYLVKVNQAVSKATRTIIQEGFNQTSKYHADVFGIGREIYRRYPAAWKKLIVSNPEYLTEVKMDIIVNANVRRSGLIFNPSSSMLD